MAFADIIKTQEIDNNRKSLEIYEKLAVLIQNLFSRIERKISLKGVDPKDFTDVINEAVLMVVNGDRGLLDLTYRSSPENYLICHTVNVCILSLEIGRGVGDGRRVH
ncbi:MAG: hypothetical protein HY762_05025 [Planctomycetes bacterium]|nr:hypothetical protein [Planctomycetota bacterium]